MSNKKKYGLTISKQKSSVVKGDSRLSVFQSDDENDEMEKAPKNQPQPSGTASVSSKQDAKVNRHVQNQIAKALAEDPSVFEYDQVFDEMEKKKVEKLEEKRADQKREPKYVKQLLKAAEKRQHEYEAREERKQMKEREKEEGEFEDKEVFVTGAYRKKMEELENYKQEEKRKELLESMMDVTKQKDITGFYKHFLNDMTSADQVMTSSELEDKKEDPREPAAPVAVKQEAIDENTGSETKVKEPEIEVKEKPIRSYRTRERSESPMETESDGKNERSSKKHESESRKSSKNKSSKKHKKSRDKSSEHAKREKETPIVDKNENHGNVGSDSDGEKIVENNRKDDTKVVQLTEKEEKELKIKQRLQSLRQLLARHNDEDAVEAYRQRYFARRALIDSRS